MFCAALVVLLLGGQPAAPAPKATRGISPDDPLAQLLELKGNERWKKLLTEMEPKGLWKQIRWSTLDEAKQEGAETGKPMLVTIKTGSKGEAHAPFT